MEKQIQLTVLRQYCDDQASSNKNNVDFPDLLSIWSFAAQSNAEPILSAVPATIAQFLRTVSSELDFREFGISLCHSLLRKEQLALFEGGLSAPKFKEFLISPCLRLLTEVASFDGGVLASKVFSRRDDLLKRLDSLLDTAPSHQQDNSRRGPSVRRNAQRLLLTLLKYLDSGSKVELVMQGKAIYSCLRKLPSDGGDIVLEMLESFRKHVIDADLSRHVKTRFLSSANLSLIASLYDFEPEDVDHETNTTSIIEAAHQFLLHVCTTDKAALLQQSGWYPSGFNIDKSAEPGEDEIDLGLDSPYYFDQYETTLPIKNTNLAAVLQSLRPQRDTLQAELITKIFESAPELVADYFVKKPHIPIASKDESVWRGHFAFIFSVVNLPVLKNCGWIDGTPIMPPPASVVVESILPRPMDRTALLHCLKSKDETTIISAARLMTKVLAKLTEVQEVFLSFSASGEIWDQASIRLGELISARAPTYHDFITALQSAPKEQTKIRQVLLECMVAYNKALPASTSGSKFDVGPLLTETSNQILLGGQDSDTEDDLSSQVIHLAEIASFSSTIRWWHKPKPAQLCPFMNLIKVYVTSGFLSFDRSIQKVISEVVSKSGILRTGELATNALISSFYAPNHDDDKDPVPLPQHVYLFAENCMMRTSKQPVRYLDHLETAQKTVDDDSPLSLLACCVVEQWPFRLKDSGEAAIKDIADWAARLFALLKSIGENDSVLDDHFRKQLCTQGNRDAQMAIIKAFTFEDDHPTWLPNPKKVASQKDWKFPTTEPTTALTKPTQPPKDLEIMFPTPSSPPKSVKGLTNWTNPDFESELTGTSSTSHLARLIQALSSSSEETRLQSQHTLPTVMHALSSSTYGEKDQLYLLLGEILETARQHALTASSTPQPRVTGTASQKRTKDPALPSCITALAILLLSVLTDPADKMYSKASRFLLRGPTWTPVTRIIPYWIDQILLQEPDYDEPYMWELEVHRLLDLLVDGMRTEQDLDLYRKSGVFERTGSLYFAAPLAMKMGMRKKILHVIRNAIEVEGGADTLVTRVGVRSWLEMVRAKEGKESEMGLIVGAFFARLETRCSKESIERWTMDRAVYREAK